MQPSSFKRFCQQQTRRIKARLAHREQPHRLPAVNGLVGRRPTLSEYDQRRYRRW